ncbi:hypothetical protein [Acinetobacter pollinis]|uniref:hypothetical protein n=1 Tax=Acinetobacter pollinis TaxID=2605270 RepID=UPI0018C1F948|nr:hypothetical protein [Acinetobacter pollinis]MBF7693290.1 hypothetical protein [Acinetobacter pollinis]MBF7699449.1 hypothetical protein [Acinetobacter pollinis]
MPKHTYNATKGDIQSFFTPHIDASPSNAKDVLSSLIAQSIDLTHAVTALYEINEHGKLEPIADDELLFNLVYQINTQLKLAQQAMPTAFSAPTKGSI